MRQTQEFWKQSNPREIMVFVIVVSLIIVIVSLLVAQIEIPEFVQNGFTTILGFFVGANYSSRRNGAN